MYMKNILIFGGSSDIGISLAKYLRDIGNNVIVTYNKHKVSDKEAIKCDIRNELENLEKRLQDSEVILKKKERT